MNENNNTEPVVYAVGTRGYSAYEVAVQNGFIGTEQEWLDSLKGDAGESAYQVAVEQGYTGTKDEWLASLVGPQGIQGKSAYDVAVDNGYIGTEEDWTNDFLTPDGYYNKNEINNIVQEKVKKIGQKQIIDELYNSRYVGHKGFYGYIVDTKSKPPVQGNSLMALDLAKSMGLKFVETDTTVLSDGTWVISHDTDTHNMNGTLANLKDIDIYDFKSRKVIKEYLTGIYWEYSETEQYTPITLEEYLLRAKELGLYVLPEIKWLNNGYTSSEWNSFADTIKKCGMENNIIIYAAYTSYIENIYLNLPNTPVCYTSLTTSNVDILIEDLKKYPFALACTGMTNYSDYSIILEKCIEANIPLGMWTIDAYNKAKKFFDDGGTFVVTNCLTENIDLKDFFIDYECGMEWFMQKASSYVGTGESSYEDKILSLTTSTYNMKYLHSFPIKPTDLVFVSCQVQADDATQGEIIISNTLTGSFERRVIKSSKAKEYTTINAIYIAGQDDEVIDIKLNAYSLDQTTLGNCTFKNLVVKVFSNKKSAEWEISDNIAYSYKNGIVTITKNTDISIPEATWTQVGTLPKQCIPSRNLEFPIGLGTAGSMVNGLLKVDRYGAVQIYSPSAQTYQRYTVSFVVA